jgi:hypothetical protein
MSRRGLISVLVLIPIVGIFYFLAIQNYSVEGGITTSGGAPAGAQGILVTIEPSAVDSVANTATMRLAFDATGQDIMDDEARLMKNTRLTVVSSDGASEYKFLAGDYLGRAEVTVGLYGDAAAYPLDVHDGSFTVIADTYTRDSTGALESTGDIPVSYQTMGGVNGWDIAFTLPSSPDTFTIVGMEMSRVFSTKIFAFVLLAMASLLALLALFASLLVITNRRKIEVALLPWTASLLFALPLLRTYLPNAPPIGAAIDIYIYLWVIVVAVIASVLSVLAWINQRGAEARDSHAA